MFAAEQTAGLLAGDQAEESCCSTRGYSNLVAADGSAHNFDHVAI